MLIHAANHLPDWACSANDDAMLNRVFIFNGHLSIIPPANSPAEVTYLPAEGPINDVISAVKTLLRFSDLCNACQAVQNSIQDRIMNFKPSLITKKYFH